MDRREGHHQVRSRGNDEARAGSLLTTSIDEADLVDAALGGRDGGTASSPGDRRCSLHRSLPLATTVIAAELLARTDPPFELAPTRDYALARR